MNAVILYLEMGFNGRTYVKAYMTICLVLGMVSLGAAWQGFSFVGGLLASIREAPALMPALAAVIAAAVLYGMRLAIVKRMERRSYTF